MKQVHIGILGLGTVGAGTAQTILSQRSLIQDRTGLDVVLCKAADLNIDRDFGFTFPDGVLTTCADDVLDDDRIQIVVELIGGTGIAKTFILRAFAAGKSVVTANKALLATHGPELISAANAAGVDLYFEAAVAGGIPIIKALREGLVANPVLEIYGILNGTCNYILTRMQRETVSFDDVLLDAQRLGYAEAEPSLDIDGWDTAHKAVILGQLAFGLPVTLEDVPVNGIRDLHPLDVAYAAELGYRIKLMAILRRLNGRVEVGVQPALIPDGHLMSKVDMSFNAVLVHGGIVGETLYYGRGAGSLPTASAVVADIVDVGLNLTTGGMDRIPLQWASGEAPQLVPAGERFERSYLRLPLRDEPGTMARVAKVLGDHGITMTALLQKESHEEHEFVQVVLLTGEARMDDVQLAIETLASMQDIVGPGIIRYRVEELAT